MSSQEYDWFALVQRIEALEQKQRFIHETAQRLEHYLEQLMQSECLREDQSASSASNDSSHPLIAIADEDEMETEVLQFLQPLSAQEFLQRIRSGEREFLGMDLRGLDLNQWRLRKQGTIGLGSINLAFV